jgi:glutaredoxin
MAGRRILGLLLVVLYVAFISVPVGVEAVEATGSSDEETVELQIFHGDGCPHCANALRFLDGLQEDWPALDVVSHEVWHDDANRDLFREVAAAHGVDARAVPTMFFEDSVWVGFSEAVGADIRAAVEAVVGRIEPPPETGTAIDVPLAGSVDVRGYGVVAATLVIGFADGANPCSLWALSMLLAIVVHSRSRGRVLIVGSVFLGITSLLYGLYMVGAYSALDYASEMTWIRAVVAGVAGGFGVAQIVSYLRSTRSVVAISESAKPGLYRRMRSLADPNRSTPAVVGGTAVLAIGVSLLETPCTAGLPLLWTNMLSDRGVSDRAAVVLFAVYLSVFLLDEVILFLAAVFTMRAAKLQVRHGELLHLVAGSLMTTLAITMLVAPEALETLLGAVVVFGAAGALGLVVAESRRLLPAGS